MFMFDIIKSSFGKLFRKFDKGYSYYLTIYLIINVAWVFLGMFSNYYFKFAYHSFSTSYVLLFVFNFIIIFLLNIFRKIKFDKIDVFLVLLVVFGIIATVFSGNISISLYGWWRRFEGFFQLLYYYSLMYLCSTVLIDKYKKWIIRFILIFGLLNVFVSVLQIFDILKFIPIPYRGNTLGNGFTINSNFFGSYMILCLGLSIGLFLFNSSKRYSIIRFIVCICFYVGLLLSSALSGMVGLFFVMLLIGIYFIYLFKKKFDKHLFFKSLILFISCICVSVCLTLSNKTLMFGDVKRLSAETKEIAKGNLDDSYGSFRLYIWKNTLKVVPRHLLHGVGIDNFYSAFGDLPLFMKFGDEIYYCDKAHNEYLQKLVCEGIFSCLTYIGMLFVIFFSSVKRILSEKNHITIALLLSFCGYCVQAFFNISVIEVAPLFWIVCGLLYDRKKKII